MELPRIAANSGSLRTRYIIETKNLSYKLCGQIDELNWLLWKKTADDNAYILRKVNCEARPGEIMAIAGPSGAGKSTLLEILAGIIPPSRVSGEVLVNGQPMNARCFRRLSGYVAQDEAFFPLLTVKETLMYSARLRLPGSFHTAAAIVQELLKQLGLEHVANVRIGSESNRGISGGEKRRVSVGVDLVHDPGVLLIDEPTSGLDSASALHIILLLKSMAIKQAKTIVLTIHQPGFRILELFDKILLLSNGTVHHHGSLHLLKQRLRFAGHFIPRHVNVLEFAIEMTESLAMEDSEARETENSDVAQDEELTRRNNRYSNIEETIYANGRFKEVLILGQRFSHIICRTNQLFAARILQAVLGAVVLGTLFMNVMNDSKRHKLQTQIGFFVFSLTFLLSSTAEGQPIFLQERRILKRETSKGAYRVSSYVVSNTLVFLPFLLVVAILYSTPVYWLVGLRRTTDGFLYFLLVAWMVVLMSNSFVACFSALVPNFIMGTSLIAGLVGSFFLFSGYFIPKDDMPKYWIFMHYLSLFKYPFECFMINEYGGEEGKRKCLKNIEGSCYLYGEEFLKQQGVEESNKWSNLAVMTGFILGYRLLCFLILLCRSYRTRI
ncbi:PREDICTED: ABC transporter G family member 10-like [Populus euphratica]|uniref:ABC transporter G family member 10-like n=1 Tax=Populus euphratica TaxID=75702 RepID=A0AAJ6Y134_POPEU|nr:PREDICTED: ABC transporter G family member 10-like [Populus euphratica]